MLLKIIAISVAMLSIAAFSEPPSKGGGDKGAGGKGQHRRPPAEAFAACHGKASGADCTFNSQKRGSVSGTCWSPKKELPLACKPKNMPVPPAGGGGGDTGMQPQQPPSGDDGPPPELNNSGSGD